MENAPQSIKKKKIEIDLHCGHCIQKVIKGFLFWKLKHEKFNEIEKANIEKNQVSTPYVFQKKNQNAVSHNHINERKNLIYGMQ